MPRRQEAGPGDTSHNDHANSRRPRGPAIVRPTTPLATKLRRTRTQETGDNRRTYTHTHTNTHAQPCVHTPAQSIAPRRCDRSYISLSDASASTSQAGSVSGALTLIAASFISSYSVELATALSSLTREVFAEEALREKLAGAGGLPGGRGGLPDGPSVTAPRVLVRKVGESSSPRLLCELSMVTAPSG